MSAHRRHGFTTGFRVLARSFRASSLFVIAASVLAKAPEAQAVYIRSDHSVASYNGITSMAAFAPTGYLADSQWGIAYSSGTLVTPTKILTAAHVVDEDGNLKIDDPTHFAHTVFGLGANLPKVLTPNVASVAINPAYKGGIAGFDLAVITLKKPITNVAPAKLSSANAVNMRGAMVGYGYQGTGLRDGLSGSNDKLAAFNMISAYQNNTYLTDFDSPLKNTSTFGPSTPLTYEGTTAPGDSGGPIYGDFGNGNWQIVGVLNGGYNDKGPDSHYGDISIYAALTDPKNISFLKSQGLTISPTRGITALDLSTTDSTRAISDVPEPASAGLLLPLVGLLLKRRRRAAIG